MHDALMCLTNSKIIEIIKVWFSDFESNVKVIFERLCFKNTEDQCSQPLDGCFKSNICQGIDTRHKQTGNSVQYGNKYMI